MLLYERCKVTQTSDVSDKFSATVYGRVNEALGGVYTFIYNVFY